MSCPRAVRWSPTARGPFCVMAHQAVRKLHGEGRKARRLDEGWPEWHLSELKKNGKR